MNSIFTIHKFFAGWISVALILIFLWIEVAGAAETPTDIETKIDSMPASEMAERALVDTLYYNFDPWLHRFKHRIKQLEAGPQTLANQLELMRFYFYMAGRKSVV